MWLREVITSQGPKISVVEAKTISESCILCFIRSKLLFTTKCHLSGEVTGLRLERGMQLVYLQNAVIEKRDILLTKGRKNKKKAGEFPGSPVVRTLCFHCWGVVVGLSLVGSAKSPQAARRGQK